jgi:hypothetical protein
MIYISHRGNLNGIISERENAPDYIDEALAFGFECEIDLRMKSGLPYLGHDFAQYPTSKEWLEERISKLWIHAKDYEGLIWLIGNLSNSKFFCHESDRFTLISNGMIWSHDFNNIMTEKCVIPLLDLESVRSYSQKCFYAVCSDFIFDCVEKFEVP